MTRQRLKLNYTAPTVPTTVAQQMFDPSVPVEGWYKHRIRSGGMYVAVHLWFGLPIEPWTGEVMDRAPTWNCTINGKWAEVGDVWPRCAKDPIDEAEARHLMNLQQWGEETGHEAVADPRRRLDPLHTPLMF